MSLKHRAAITARLKSIFAHLRIINSYSPAAKTVAAIRSN